MLRSLNVFTQVSFYRNGRPIGPTWQFKIGGGFLTGNVDSSGKLTGNRIVYSYPDFETLLVGKFVDGKMVSAKESRFSGLGFDPKSGLPVLKFDKKMIKETGEVFNFDLSTGSWIGRKSHLEDPFEKKLVFVNKSSIPGAGNGLFLRFGFF